VPRHTGQNVMSKSIGHYFAVSQAVTEQKRTPIYCQCINQVRKCSHPLYKNVSIEGNIPQGSGLRIYYTFCTISKWGKVG